MYTYIHIYICWGTIPEGWRKTRSRRHTCSTTYPKSTSSIGLFDTWCRCWGSGFWGEVLPAAALSRKPTPYPTNRRPILLTDALSCQPRQTCSTTYPNSTSERGAQNGVDRKRNTEACGARTTPECWRGVNSFKSANIGALHF